MGTSQNEGRMEGWLYLVRSNRFGLQYSRKRYFVLERNALNCYRTAPVNGNQETKKTVVLDSCIRVMDNGRESIHNNVFFVFTLYNSSNQSDQLKLGARSSEEAAKWIHCLMEVKENPNCQQKMMPSSKRKWQSLRMLGCGRSRIRMHSIDWTVFSSMNSDPTTSDVISPSPWTIFGCKNGLRLFKETKEGDFRKRWDDHPAVMAVGVVDASSEAIFQTVMSLGPSRSEWDFCFERGDVVDHIDGHTDIIHKQLKDDWLPWGMRRRDLLLQRYWRREDDGTYVILYHSVFHEKCRPKRGYVRACLKSGGYVISPVNQGQQSVVKHMLAIDWRLWKSYLFTSSAKYVTIQMLGRVAALRELFKAELGSHPTFHFSCDMTREVGVPITIVEETKEEVSNRGENSRIVDSTEEPQKLASSGGSLLQLNNASDEFFDVPDPSEFCDSDAMWSSNPYMDSQDQHHQKITTAADIVKRIQGLAAQKKGYIGLPESASEERSRCIYGATLPKDVSCNLPCSWTTTDPSTFLIRGETYLQDHHKVKASGTLMEMVAADWLKSDKREDDLAGRPSSIVQKYAVQGGNEFFFIINIQVPGTTTYSLALYYMMDKPLEKVPLLESFVNGDDAYRNSRFKLIPYISKGSWIVKQSVGKKACLVGQALEINYFRGRNYLELGVDVGSSTVARGVVNLVLGYFNNLVIEMAFLIQGNNPEELPEFLLGTCRLNHLDVSKSVLIRP